MDVMDLWLPILVSGVALHFSSTLAWMALPHHKKDWVKLDDEDAFLKAVKDLGVKPGQYIFPGCASPEEMKSDAFKRKVESGPAGTLSVWGSKMNMGKNIGLTVLFFLVSSLLIGYLSTLALEPGASFREVFRFVSTAGVLTFCCAGIPNAIWFKKRHLLDVLDGVAYAVVCGLVFAALWPGK